MTTLAITTFDTCCCLTCARTFSRHLSFIVAPFGGRRKLVMFLLPIRNPLADTPIRLRVDDLEPGLAQRALRLHLGPAHDARHAEKMRAAVQPAAVRDVVLADDAHVAEHQPGVGGERRHRERGRRATTVGGRAPLGSEAASSATPNLDDASL